MVSGTRCPAGSDPVKKRSESRAAAPKGRCHVGHGQKLCTSFRSGSAILGPFEQFSMIFNGSLALT